MKKYNFKFLQHMTAFFIFCLLLCALIPSVSALSEKDAAHYSEISSALDGRVRKLDVHRWKYTSSEVFSAIDAVVMSRPEMNCTVTPVCYSYDNKRTAEYVELTYTERSRERAMAERAAIERLTDSIGPDSADWEKALAAHDALATYVRYSYDWFLNDELDSHPGVFEAGGALVERTAVCSGYAQAYARLMRSLGVACYVADVAGYHAWNVVKIGGSWYHVDVTWDDPVWDNLGRVDHKWFLLSEGSLLSLDPQRNGYVVHDTPDTPYFTATDRSFESGFWLDSETMCCRYMGKWYYIDAQRKQLMCADSAARGKALLDIPDSTWPVYGSPGATWKGCFSRMMISGCKLYFSSSCGLWTYDIETCKTEQILRHGTQGYIYGFGAYEDGMGYVVRMNPDHEGFETVIPLNIHTAHAWNDGEVLNAADYSRYGLLRRACAVCGEEMTRVMAVTRPADVRAGVWYDQAVEWAVGNGIVSGAGTVPFAPDSPCSRAQMATFLWRAAGCPEPRSISAPFTDVKPSDYCWKAVLWVWENGIMLGTSQSTFGPEVSCTCGQAAVILGRLGADVRLSSPVESVCSRAQAVYLIYQYHWILSR